MCVDFAECRFKTHAERFHFQEPLTLRNPEVQKQIVDSTREILGSSSSLCACKSPSYVLAVRETFVHLDRRVPDRSRKCDKQGGIFGRIRDGLALRLSEWIGAHVVERAHATEPF